MIADRWQPMLGAAPLFGGSPSLVKEAYWAPPSLATPRANSPTRVAFSESPDIARRASMGLITCSAARLPRQPPSPVQLGALSYVQGSHDGVPEGVPGDVLDAELGGQYGVGTQHRSRSASGFDHRVQLLAVQAEHGFAQLGIDLEPLELAVDHHPDAALEVGELVAAATRAGSLRG